MQELTHPQLVERMFTYTRETLSAFRREGCLPNMVEVGNEITNGMLWPDAGPLSDPTTWNTVANPTVGGNSKWDALADLLKAGIRGVRAVDPDNRIKVMIHIDKGGDAALSRSYFDNLKRRGVPFDVIGLSYDPFWRVSLKDLQNNLDALAHTYHKEIIVAATPDGLGRGVFYWAPK